LLAPALVLALGLSARLASPLALASLVVIRGLQNEAGA
jgi:hypothetical protein